MRNQRQRLLSDALGFATAEEALMPRGGVIDTVLREMGCECSPHFVTRTLPADPLPIKGKAVIDGQEVEVELFSGPTTEGVLAHAESCPLHVGDPFG